MTATPARTSQILVGTAAAIALLYFLRAVLIPFVVAYVLMVLVSALVRSIQKLWAGAPFWAVSIAAGLAVIVSASAGIFIMAQGAAHIVAEGPALLTRLDRILLDLGYSMHLKEQLRVSTLIGQVSISQIAGFLLNQMQGLVTGLLLMIVYFGFLLAGQRRMPKKIEAAAGSSARAASVIQTGERISTAIETYVWVQTITGAMITLSAAIVMVAVGLHDALFWIVLFFLLTYIPNIGVTIGSIAPALFAFVQFPTLWQGFAIFGVTQITATFVGNFIFPRMQAETQNIDPVVTLLSLAFWTLLWGLAGSFLAVPLTLAVMMVFAQFESTRWVSAMLSNDGKPSFVKPVD